MPKIKCVALDIDGVLKPPRRGMFPSWESIQLISKVLNRIAKNTSTIFITGRSPAWIEAMISVYNLQGKIIAICEHGSIIYYINRDSNGNIRDNEKLHPKILKNNINPILIRNIVEETLISKNIPVSFEPKKAMVTINPVNKEDLDKVYEIIKKSLEIYRDEVEVTKSQSSVDVTVKGVNKGSAFRLILKELEISSRYTLGIGDSESDISFMEITKYIGCPANAQEKLKEYVRKRKGIVSEKPDVEGTIDIISRYSEDFI